MIRSLFYSPPSHLLVLKAEAGACAQGCDSWIQRPAPSENVLLQFFFLTSLLLQIQFACSPPKCSALLFLTQFGVNPTDPHLRRGLEEPGVYGVHVLAF